MDYEQAIIAAVSNDSVCGDNLEDDTGFQNFFFAAEGTPERFDGQNTTPAEPPDWREIKKQALDYLTKTKDIKLVCLLSQSVLNTEGIVKFEQCLAGLSQLIETQWASVYPPLDEDDGDPMERISALGYLNHSFVISALKTTPLASAKGVGQVTLQSVDKAVADAPDSTLSISQIKGIFGEAESQETKALVDAVTQSGSHLRQINQCFIQNAGNENSVAFEPVLDVLQHLEFVFGKYANIKAVAQDPEPQPESEGETVSASVTNGVSAAGGASTAVAGNGVSGPLSSRTDVQKCLDSILDYYAQYEPSSPVPILVHRARKLVHMDFLAIMKDIYPDALSTLHQLGGIENEETESDSGSADDSW